MKRLLNKYSPLKLKTRVKHYLWDTYCVQYSYYMFIPIYHTLYNWSDDNKNRGDLWDYGWVPLMSHYHNAINSAKGFDTYEKIIEFKKRAAQCKKNYKKPKTNPRITNVN